MDIWTAQYQYPGPHRLDITVKGQDPIGRLFAPTWDMVNTKDAILIEDNHWHDNFWGDCHCPKCEHIKGVNMLGQLTMAKREAL